MSVIMGQSVGRESSANAVGMGVQGAGEFLALVISIVVVWGGWRVENCTFCHVSIKQQMLVSLSLMMSRISRGLLFRDCTFNSMNGAAKVGRVRGTILSVQTSGRR